jgi:hypothetical protein
LHKAQGAKQGSVQAGSRTTPDRAGDRTWELIYFKLYKSQLPVIEQALETAALMLGSDKSRGYMLEMICADFLAGANLETGNLGALLLSLERLFTLLPGAKAAGVPEQSGRKLVMPYNVRRPRLKLDASLYKELHRRILERDGWRCQYCGSMTTFRFITFSHVAGSATIPKRT